jgi:BASS family bile acid:Na+ symporter
MTTQVTVQLLFIALALVMAGLGLSLEMADFRRVFVEKRTVWIALTLQMVILPLVALSIAVGMRLQMPYAVGLMLLAAAPSSISSNLYTHVFGGNVALNVSLTGVNTALSFFSLPLICNWALGHFAASDAALPPVTTKLLETMATLVGPVVLGMAVRTRFPAFAKRADRPMRIFSVLVLVVFSAGAIVKEWQSLVKGFAEVGGSVVVFNLLSLAVGYTVAHLMTLDRRGAITLAFQLGIRSAVLSIYVAMTALKDTQFALPAAVYSITMVVFGLSFGLWARGHNDKPSEKTAALAES